MLLGYTSPVRFLSGKACVARNWQETHTFLTLSDLFSALLQPHQPLLCY